MYVQYLCGLNTPMNRLYPQRPPPFPPILWFLCGKQFHSGFMPPILLLKLSYLYDTGMVSSPLWHWWYVLPLWHWYGFLSSMTLVVCLTSMTLVWCPFPYDTGSMSYLYDTDMGISLSDPPTHVYMYTVWNYFQRLAGSGTMHTYNPSPCTAGGSVAWQGSSQNQSDVACTWISDNNENLKKAQHPMIWALPYTGVGICPRGFERQTIIVSICNVACSVYWTQRQPVIYYNLLAAIGAVSGMFAYNLHPGGQA